MEYKSTDSRVKTMEIRYYYCMSCVTSFRRFIHRNNLGLIKSDSIYQMEGNTYVDAWN